MPAKHLMPGKNAVLAAANAGMQARPAHPAEAHAVRAADATSAVNAENSPK